MEDDQPNQNINSVGSQDQALEYSNVTGILVPSLLSSLVRHGMRIPSSSRTKVVKFGTKTRVTYLVAASALDFPSFVIYFSGLLAKKGRIFNQTWILGWPGHAAHTDFS